MEKIRLDEEYATAEDDTKIDDVTANFVANGLKYNNVMYASFDSNRLSAKPGDFEKFIAQPIYDEEQWKKLVTPSTPGGGGE